MFFTFFKQYRWYQIAQIIILKVQMVFKNICCLDRWETDNEYCQKFTASPPYDKGPRLLDIMDTAIFDFIIGNVLISYIMSNPGITFSSLKSKKTPNAGNVCLFKVNNRNNRKRYEICSMLTIKTPERRQ